MPGPNESSRLEALFLAVMFAILGVGVVAAGGRQWLPALASHHGAGIDRMLQYLLLTTGALLLVGHVVLAWFVFRFSRQSRVSHRLASPKAERAWSIALGLVMTVVAEGGVLAIGLPVFQQYFVDEAPEDAIVVEITGEQFAWNIRYPGADGVFGRTRAELITTTNPLGMDPEDPAGADDRMELNNLYLQVDRGAKVVLRSKDVLHSFYLPNLRVKQDAVPGMRIPIWFQPTTEGRFDIACAELCGLAHYRMQGFVHVLSASDYSEWERGADEVAAAAAGF
ncbi:MAG: cytochrome-c oxidase [Thermoanaerobaculia bacterium]|nr:cytochrome-c oxidase [Thermoanaerobaculia bacterium]